MTRGEVRAFCPIPGQNLTKMFHVKHFCPIRPQNLTRPLTSGGFERVGSRRILVHSAGAPRGHFERAFGHTRRAFGDVGSRLLR